MSTNNCLNKETEIIRVLPKLLASVKSLSPVIRKSASTVWAQAINLASFLSLGKSISNSTSTNIVTVSRTSPQSAIVSGFNLNLVPKLPYIQLKFLGKPSKNNQECQ